MGGIDKRPAGVRMTNATINDTAEKYAKLIHKAKGKTATEIVWDHIRYCVLEFHYAIETEMDKIILKRYIGRDLNVVNDIKVGILSKIDFYRKIAILDEIDAELKIGMPINKIKVINNIRNALIHNYPKSHSSFNYRGGHILKDLKFECLCEDILEVFKELQKIHNVIAVKPYRR